MHERMLSYHRMGSATTPHFQPWNYVVQATSINIKQQSYESKGLRSNKLSPLKHPKRNLPTKNFDTQYCSCKFHTSITRFYSYLPTCQNSVSAYTASASGLMNQRPTSHGASATGENISNLCSQ